MTPLICQGVSWAGHETEDRGVSPSGEFGDVRVELGSDRVATAEIRRPPNNFFDQGLIASLCDAFEALDRDEGCRAIVLCSEGKHFCAGANFGSREPVGRGDPGRHLYDEGVRLFRTRTPVVAAIQGAAIGGGLGLALMPDFRVAAPEARFSANFARLGFHHGFGLSVTLPALVGQQHAMDLLYTGRRVKGEEALAIGLCDRLVPLDQLRSAARELAAEIAASAPLAVDSIRQTLRGDLAERIRVATDREKAEQERLQATEDFKEGIAAMAERRTPDFKGR
jgi:2-(1,2-epoxy-1,2-dihydrophenyl)acetyl-CoA isomerase